VSEVGNNEEEEEVVLGKALGEKEGRLLGEEVYNDGDGMVSNHNR
jgi:hypothetical protein